MTVKCSVIASVIVAYPSWALTAPPICTRWGPEPSSSYHSSTPFTFALLMGLGQPPWTRRDDREPGLAGYYSP